MRARSLARITLLQLTFLAALHGRIPSFVNALTVVCLHRHFHGYVTGVFCQGVTVMLCQVSLHTHWDKSAISCLFQVRNGHIPVSLVFIL